MLEGRVASYLASETVVRRLSDRKAELSSLVQVKNDILQRCNVVLSALERKGWTLVVKVDVFKADVSSELNGLFTNVGRRGMLEARTLRP